MTAGRLVVCPTPIGNLEDITLRALSALRDADVVACEDTRRTRKLLDRYGVKAPLVSYHEHNERARARELVERMRDGAVVALVSDAGMPLGLRPGFVLVQACVAAGLAVEVLPGPSAALTALVASGLPADRWRFAGFLPRKRGELAAAFARAGDARGLRVAAPGRGLAGGAGRARPPAAGRRLPRADQGPRGGRARHGGRARGPLRADASARGGRAGGRPGRSDGAGVASPRSTRCAGSSRQAPSRVRRRRWCPSSRESRPTTLYRALTGTRLSSRRGQSEVPPPCHEATSHSPIEVVRIGRESLTVF